MRLFPVFFVLLSLMACATRSPSGILEHLTFSPKEILPTPARDISHEDPDSKIYLSIDLPFPPFERMRQSIERNLKVNLNNRGEAHITVITPPEFKKIQKKVSMKEISDLAKKMKIVDSSYRPLCVGKGEIKNSPQAGSTFYVVVEFDRLFELRQRVYSLYLSRGGASEDFSPETFYPHITLGFTKRDLHFEDGVIKDASSCIFSLHPEETVKN